MCWLPSLAHPRTLVFRPGPIFTNLLEQCQKLFLFLRNKEEIPKYFALRLFEGFSGHLFASTIKANDPALPVKNDNQRAHRVQNCGYDVSFLLQFLLSLFEVRDVESNRRE